MKKTILCFTMALAMLFLLCSCGEEEAQETDNTIPVEIAMVE